MTEFKSDGTPIFHVYMDSGLLGEGVENYRAFRYNWTGYPTEEPAIIAEKTPSGTEVYVSWNGDTETAAWRFYAVTDKHGSRSFLGETQRQGFETSFFLSDHSYYHVAAEAISAHGRVLKTTHAVRLQEQVLPPGSGALSAGAADRKNWRQVVLQA